MFNAAYIIFSSCINFKNLSFMQFFMNLFVLVEKEEDVVIGNLLDSFTLYIQGYMIMRCCLILSLFLLHCIAHIAAV